MHACFCFLPFDFLVTDFLLDGKGSDTEYESYDEEYDDEEGVFYINQGGEQIGQEQIHLPKYFHNFHQQNYCRFIILQKIPTTLCNSTMSWF